MEPKYIIAIIGILLVVVVLYITSTSAPVVTTVPVTTVPVTTAPVTTVPVTTAPVTTAPVTTPTKYVQNVQNPTTNTVTTVATPTYSIYDSYISVSPTPSTISIILSYSGTVPAGSKNIFLNSDIAFRQEITSAKLNYILSALLANHKYPISNVTNSAITFMLPGNGDPKQTADLLLTLYQILHVQDQQQLALIAMAAGSQSKAISGTVKIPLGINGGTFTVS